MAERNIIGLIAGRGRLPWEVLLEIKARGQQAVVVGLAGEADQELSTLAERFYQVGIGRLGEIISIFQQHAPAELVFAGKVGKEALFREGFDPVFQRLLNELPQKNDDAILLALVKEFEKYGLIVAKQTSYLQKLLAPLGAICGKLSGPEQNDANLGFRIAKAMGGLDIGQSVVVKGGVVLAVEAIEGTDQAIIRGGQLGGPGAVVVKVSKPEQDERFDVPTIGATTLRSMMQVKASVLAVEAGKTLITEKDSLLQLAEDNQIKIVAV